MSVFAQSHPILSNFRQHTYILKKIYKCAHMAPLLRAERVLKRIQPKMVVQLM